MAGTRLATDLGSAIKSPLQLNTYWLCAQAACACVPGRCLWSHRANPYLSQFKRGNRVQSNVSNQRQSRAGTRSMHGAFLCFRPCPGRLVSRVRQTTGGLSRYNRLGAQCSGRTRGGGGAGRSRESEEFSSVAGPRSGNGPRVESGMDTSPGPGIQRLPRTLITDHPLSL